MNRLPALVTLLAVMPTLTLAHGTGGITAAEGNADAAFDIVQPARLPARIPGRLSGGCGHARAERRSDAAHDARLCDAGHADAALYGRAGGLRAQVFGHIPDLRLGAEVMALVQDRRVDG